MPYEIINRFRGPSTVRVTDVTDTSELSVNAFSARANTENVNTLMVTSVKFALIPTSGILTISRNVGPTPIVIAELYGTGDWKHDELSISNTATSNGTIRFQLAGGGTAMITVRKDASYNVDTSAMDRW